MPRGPRTKSFSNLIVWGIVLLVLLGVIAFLVMFGPPGQKNAQPAPSKLELKVDHAGIP